MGGRDTTGFCHQLRLLLWKNLTLKKRSPVVFIVEAFIPLVLFIILMLIRRSDVPTPHSAATFPTQPLPSTGLIPILQSFCGTTTDNPNIRVRDFLQTVQEVLRSGQEAADFLERKGKNQTADVMNRASDVIGKMKASPGFELRTILKHPERINAVLERNFNLSTEESAILSSSSVNTTRVAEIAEQLLTNIPTTSVDDITQPDGLVKVIKTLLSAVYTKPPSFTDLMNLAGVYLKDSRRGDLSFVLSHPALIRFISCHPDVTSLLTHPTAVEKDVMGRVLQQLCMADDWELQELADVLRTETNATALSQQLNMTRPAVARLQDAWSRSTQWIDSLHVMLKTVSDWADGLPETTCCQGDSSSETTCNQDNPNKPNATSSEHREKYAVLLSAWRTIQPYLCQLMTGPQHNGSHSYHQAGPGKLNGWVKRMLTILAHLLYSNPKILFAPNNTVTRTVVDKVNETFQMYAALSAHARTWLNVSQSLKQQLNSSSFLPTEWNATSNGGKLLDRTLARGLTVLDHVTCLWLKLVSGIDFDIFRAFPTEAELEDYFLNRQYHDNVIVIAGLVFESFNSTMTQLPPHVRYKIRQNATFTDSTKLARNTIWMPSPGNGKNLYYYFGFVWLQDLVDRAIIDLQTGRPVVEPGNMIREFPYPCWRSDGFIWLIQHLLPLILMLSWVYPVAVLVQRIVSEKEKRLKEVMKMMGLSDGVHWCAWFISAICQMTVTTVTLTLMLYYGKILGHSNPVIVFILLELFAFSSIGFSFLVSSCFSKAKLAAACAGIFYFLSYLPYVYLSIKQDLTDAHIADSVKTAAALSSTTALGLAGKQFLFYEMQGTGIQWDNVMHSPLELEQFSLFVVLLMMAIDTLLYLLLAWYIENIHPGTYGIPKPWYFPFLKSYWVSGVAATRSRRTAWFGLRRKGKYSALADDDNDDDDELLSPTELDSKFEAEPPEAVAGVKIKGLTKVYHKGDPPAVNRLNLNLYEDQITALLGHNGAGKTTTMSVLTGLFPATSGHASIYGDDIRTDMEAIRQNLGMCPQHNVLFNSLTVEEHLWFYARLKGMKTDDIKEETDIMLRDLGLTWKRGIRVTCLSGGMQRKLSVAIAFVGASRTVILDEPTAGVDPYSRRSIWKLLQQYKAGRTILLSTHHMDEAEILGDRIAVLSLGELKCCGSPVYLKGTLGDGDHLHVLKAGSGGSDVSDASERLVSLVQSCIPTARLVSETEHEIHVTLPLQEEKKKKFGDLFEQLENRKQDLRIQHFGVTESSLEEVLIRVTEPDLAADDNKRAGATSSTGHSGNVAVDMCQFSAASGEDGLVLSEIERVGASRSTHSGEGNCDGYTRLSTISRQDCSHGQGSYRLSGMALKLNQFRALVVKRFRYICRNRKSVFSQVLLPALFVSIAMTISLAAPKAADPPPIELSTAQYYKLTQPRGNVVPFANRFTSARGQFYADDAGPKDLLQTFYLPSGIGASCLLKSPFHSQYDQEVIGRLQKVKDIDQKFELLSKYFIDSCSKVFVPGIKLTKYIPHAAVFKTYTNSSEAWKDNDRPVPPYYPVCHCSKDSVNFECPAGGYVDPPEFEVVSRDHLQNITGTDETPYYLYTTDRYRLHRYGGFSVGGEHPYVPDMLGLEAPLRNVLRRFAVRGTSLIWFNLKGYHALPTYLNAMNNAILRANLPAHKGNPAAYGITAVNHPMKQTNNVLQDDYITGNTDVIMAILIIVAMAFVPASFVLFLVHERSIKAKHLQFISGVDPITYWLANYCWDMCNYVIPATCIICILLAFNIPAYVAPGNLQAVIGLFLLYGWSITPMMYPASFLFREPSDAYIILIVVNLFTGITCVVSSVLLEQFSEDTPSLSQINDVMKEIFLIFPNYCLGNGLMSIALNQYKTDYYSHIGEYSKIQSALQWDIAIKKMVVMAVSGVVFFLLTILCEYRFFLRCRRGRAVKSVESSVADEDSDVAEERRRILTSPRGSDLLRLENLTKVYKTKKFGDLLAVDQLCLGVHGGECFGLLGVNGAGKTTTFKMLTGDVQPTAGDAFLNSHSIVNDLQTVNQDTGYCPQFDALFDELTGREHLQLFARMRGVPPAEEGQVAEWAIRKLSLSRYADKPARVYSGGNKRKLSTAIALLGNPALIYMDEPTTGMDPYSRRFLWDTIRALVKDGKSVVFTSHSMEECEALCTRLAIMVNGRLRCLGSIQHLKEKYGRGYTVAILLRDSAQASAVRASVERHLPECVLSETRYNTLLFKARSLEVGLANVFRKLEEMMESFEIENYSVSQNTLDGVFVNFALQQKELARDLELNQDPGPSNTSAESPDEPLIDLTPRGASSNTAYDEELLLA